MLKPLFFLPAFFFFVPSPWQNPPAPSAPSAPQTAPSQAAPPASAYKIPAEAMQQTNPVKPTAASQTRAKQIYTYDCVMCHGASGDGKGDMAAGLTVPLLDYTQPGALANKTDGELFYIIKNGKDPMPAETGRASDAEMWNLVIYIRSLALKQRVALRP